jgi:hypothetical protein
VASSFYRMLCWNIAGLVIIVAGTAVLIGRVGKFCLVICVLPYVHPVAGTVMLFWHSCLAAKTVVQGR